MQTGNALARLCDCTASPEPSLFAWVMRTIFTWTDIKSCPDKLHASVSGSIQSQRQLAPSCGESLTPILTCRIEISIHRRQHLEILRLASLASIDAHVCVHVVAFFAANTINGIFSRSQIFVIWYPMHWFVNNNF